MVSVGPNTVGDPSPSESRYIVQKLCDPFMRVVPPSPPSGYRARTFLVPKVVVHLFKTSTSPTSSPPLVSTIIGVATTTPVTYFTFPVGHIPTFTSLLESSAGLKSSLFLFHRHCEHFPTPRLPTTGSFSD